MAVSLLTEDQRPTHQDMTLSYWRSILVVKNPYTLLLCLYDRLQTIVQRQRSVPNFFDHCLEKDNRRGKETWFHEIHLGQEHVCVRKNKVALREYFMLKIARSRKNLLCGAGTYSTALYSTANIVPQVSFAKNFSIIRNWAHNEICPAPLITLPLAVFLKNLRCVTTASERGRFLIEISTM